MTYVLDTNIISYLLRGEGNVRSHFRQEIEQADGLYAIPFVVVYEIKRWLLDNPTKILRVFDKEFDSLFEPVRNEAEIVADIWAKVADIYITLKQKGQLIGDADILIAAYCLINNYTLVTNNTNDFNRINGLMLVNWYQ